MNRFLPLFCVALLTTSVCLQAQDPYFSQFYANRVYLNPAYAGFDPGATVTLNYRDQWFGLPDGKLETFSESYRTINATGEVHLPCFLDRRNTDVGLALSVFGDYAGSAPLATKGIALAYSLALKMGKVSGPKDNSFEGGSLHLGMQTSLMQRTLKWGHFIYSDQLDPVTGLKGDPSVLNLTSGMYPNLNIGVFYRTHFRSNRKKTRTRGTIGFSISNVNRPDIALRDAAGAAFLPMRTTLHGGLQTAYHRTRKRSPVFLSPQFRLDSQAGYRLNSYSVGGYLSSGIIYTGIFYQDNFSNKRRVPGATNGFITRNTNALILTSGIEIPETHLLIGVTYDINLSGLRTNNTLGVVEINIRMNFVGKGKRGCSPRFPTGCPINNF